MRLLNSARIRLVMAIAVMSSLMIALLLALVYWTAIQLIDGETRSVVDAELRGLAESYADLGILGLVRTIDRRVEYNEGSDVLYLLADRFGQTLAGNLAAWPSGVEPGSGWVELELIRTDKQKSVPIAAASILLRGNERLLVGRDASARNQFAGALWQAALLALFAAILLSFLVGWLLTRAFFGRIGAISETASEIMSGDLSRRMPSGGGEDEMDQLARTLNAMLDRIEELVSNLRMTTDSLSHDLRSPLTRLRSHIDQLGREDLPKHQRETSCASALNEVDHVLSVFSGLTEIARADAGIGRSEFQRIDLADVVRGVATLYQPLAEERHISMRVDAQPALISGNKALLEQVFSNLLENALRYAPAETEITVSSVTTGNKVRAFVCDRGKGIPETERARVMEPFVTLDPSRTDRATGLGLALVDAIARLHGGSVSLTDSGPGLTVIVTLPKKE